MQNKKLQQALQDITDSLNEEIRELNHLYCPMSADDLMSNYNPFVNGSKVVRNAVSQALTLSSKDQLIDFVLGLLNKAYAEENVYQKILFNGFKSTVNDYSLTEHCYGQLIVEMCSNRPACRPDPLLYTTLAVIVNHYADYFQDRHAQLIEEAKLVCLAKMFVSIQNKKAELQLAS
ncbi:hypothetical protein [Vibrio jasicida]|uniref:hypothetical protein n=1 Tax=Vibrio jasicida TaxID=766224 RepID=UPI0005F04742|nr:hypothetical protein [Vibrio jasicida]